MAPNAVWTLPAAAGDATRRTLYFFKGSKVDISGQTVGRHAAIELSAAQPAKLQNGPEPSELLLLQGRPIGEPVAQYGPFVMNSEQELKQAFADFQHTGFGGWPWPDNAPVHGKERVRFARHADGRVETLPVRAPAGALKPV